MDDKTPEPVRIPGADSAAYFEEVKLLRRDAMRYRYLRQLGVRPFRTGPEGVRDANGYVAFEGPLLHAETLDHFTDVKLIDGLDTKGVV